MSEQRLNIELFRAVREKIASAPAAYDQTTFGQPDEDAPCGTAACIAGWACILSGEMDAPTLYDANTGQLQQSIVETATRVLGIADNEAEILFTAEPEGEWEDYDDEGESVYSMAWPEPFRTDWEDAHDSERPFVAVDYLDHIIETGKVLE
jgi:hypothetical protein